MSLLKPSKHWARKSHTHSIVHPSLYRGRYVYPVVQNAQPHTSQISSLSKGKISWKLTIFADWKFWFVNHCIPIAQVHTPAVLLVPWLVSTSKLHTRLQIWMSVLSYFVLEIQICTSKPVIKEQAALWSPVISVENRHAEMSKHHYPACTRLPDKFNCTSQTGAGVWAITGTNAYLTALIHCR